MKLSNYLPFLKPYKIRIIFKSGQHIDFRCEDFTITAPGNDLTSYKIQGGDGNIMYFRLDDVSAIIKL